MEPKPNPYAARMEEIHDLRDAEASYNSILKDVPTEEKDEWKTAADTARVLAEKTEVEAEELRKK